jgi:Zn-dependent protease with chaperone function
MACDDAVHGFTLWLDRNRTVFPVVGVAGDPSAHGAIVITAIALGCYATLVGVCAPRVLPRRWPGTRVPRSTIALLMVLAWSLPFSVISAGLALGVTLLDALSRLDPTVDRCADQLPINDESPIAPMLGSVSIAVVAALLLRLGYCVLATYLTSRRTSREHAATLRLCGWTDQIVDATVIEHDRPASYCLPGRRGRIVITSQAVRLLSPDQLGAVLAHERAHQRGRHHLLLGLAAALRRSFPWLKMLSYAEHEVRRLVELIADDVAARDHGRLTVASALATIGTGHAPGGALAVAGVEESGTLARIVRLASPATRMTRLATAFTAVGVAAAVALPFALFAFSVAVLMRHCPPSADDESLAPRTVVRIESADGPPPPAFTASAAGA